MNQIEQMEARGWKLKSMYHWEHDDGRKCQRRDGWWMYSTPNEHPRRVGRTMSAALTFVLAQEKAKVNA